MNHSNIPQNDWNQVKKEIQKTWSSLSGDELERTHGDVKAISGLVQKKYGLKAEDAERKLDECIDRCGTQAGKASFSGSRQSDMASDESRSMRSRADEDADWDVEDYQSQDREEDIEDEMRMNSDMDHDMLPDSERTLSNERRSETNRDSRRPDVTINQKGSNPSRFASREAGNTSRSENSEKSAGTSQKAGSQQEGSRNSSRSSEASTGNRNPGSAPSADSRGSRDADRK